MARLTFGGSAADAIWSTVQSAGYKLIATLTGQSATMWSAAAGGTQYTDLLVNGSPATSVTVGTGGVLPEFQGPDGVTSMWADAGGGFRVRLDAPSVAVGGPFVKRENAKARYGSPPIGSSLDVDRFIAPNAAAKLSSIVTSPPDPNNEVVEPSVWYDPNGLFGWEFWMAAGPYANSNNAVEQPSVWVSHDGQTWRVPPGGSNPVVPAPPSGNYDDPHLYELNGTLYLIWNYTRASASDQVLMTSTTDGITWTAPVVLRTGVNSSVHEFISPHAEYQDGLWYMWTLSLVGTRTIYLSTATSLTGTWSTPVACTMPLPAGKDHWEFEVRRVGSEWWMLQCCVNTGQTAQGGELRLRTSSDGITWTMSRRPLLTGDFVGVGTKFDANFIYKSSFVPLADGRIAIWYSAGSGGTLRWSIGYTVAEIPKSTELFSGNWYAPPTGVGTGTMTSGTVYYLPIFLDKAISIQALGLEVTSAATAGSTINLGIYDNNKFGRPGRLIADLGAQAATTTGIKTYAASQTLGPGIIWLAALALGAPATPPTVRMATTPVLLIGHATAVGASGASLVGHRQVSQASLPTLATIDASIASANIPRPVWQAT